MTDQHPAAGDWTEWWPGGHDRWIKQAMSIEQLVRAAFLAGWDARNNRLTALARTPGDTGMQMRYPQSAPVMPQRVPGQQMPQYGPPPVMNLADYANSKDFERPRPPAGHDLATLNRIKERIEAITPAPGQPEVPDPDETRDLPVIRADDSPLDTTFERLQAAWTEEYGPDGPKEDSKWVS